MQPSLALLELTQIVSAVVAGVLVLLAAAAVVAVFTRPSPTRAFVAAAVVCVALLHAGFQLLDIADPGPRTWDVLVWVLRGVGMLPPVLILIGLRMRRSAGPS